MVVVSSSKNTIVDVSAINDEAVSNLLYHRP